MPEINNDFKCTYNSNNWEFSPDSSKNHEENIKLFKEFLNDKLTEELKNCEDNDEELNINEDDDVLEEEEEDDEEGEVNGKVLEVENPDKKFKSSP